MGYIEELRNIVGHRPLILSGAGVAVFNDEDEILLVKKMDGRWAIPGGFMELGESAEETGRREVFEETGIQVGKLRLVTVLSGQQTYAKLENKDEYYSVTIVYATREILGGSLTPDGIEIKQVAFFSADCLPENLNPLIASMIKNYLPEL